MQQVLATRIIEYLEKERHLLLSNAQRLAIRAHVNDSDIFHPGATAEKVKTLILKDKQGAYLQEGDVTALEDFIRTQQQEPDFRVRRAAELVGGIIAGAVVGYTVAQASRSGFHHPATPQPVRTPPLQTVGRAANDDRNLPAEARDFLASLPDDLFDGRQHNAQVRDYYAKRLEAMTQGRISITDIVPELPPEAFITYGPDMDEDELRRRPARKAAA